MSLSMESVYKITNKTLSGSESEHIVPAGAFSVTFHANGGDVTIATVSGGATYTIADTKDIEFVNRNIAGRSFWFNGTATLEIITEYGGAS